MCGYLAQRAPFGAQGYGELKKLRLRRKVRGRGAGMYEGFQRPGIAQTRAACFRLGERGLCALRNHLALMLGDGREDVNGQSVRGRHIDGHEVDAAFHQIRDEGDVAGQPVEPGDNQRGAVLAALVERGLELRPDSTSVNSDRRRAAGPICRATAARCASIPRPLAPWRSVETR